MKGESVPIASAQALRESEERLRMVGDNIPGCVIYQNVMEPDGTVRYTYISAGVERLSGLTAEEVMADAGRFRELVVEEDRPQLARAEQEALRDSAPFDCEFRWRTAAGDLKWVHCRSTPSRLADGSIRWNGAITDVTGRKQAEAEASAHELRLSMALEAAGMVTWEWDIPTATIRYADNLRSVVRGTAVQPYCSLESLMQKLHPADRDGLAQALRRAVQERSPFECEYRVHMLDGTYRWILGKGKIVVMEGGKPVRVQGLSMDITERKEAEEKLRRSEARFRLLADTAGRLLATPYPQAVVNQLCRDVMVHLECQLFFNYLTEGGPGPNGSGQPGAHAVPRLHLNACEGIPDEEVRRIEWLDYGVAVCGCVARVGTRIVAENVQRSEDPRTALVKGYGVQAYCCHPLLSEGRVIGTLSFGTTTRAAFTPEEVDLMRAVADQVAMAMRRLTARQALEATRAEALNQKNRLAAVMETLPVGVAILDAQGGIVRTNDAYNALWGGPLPPVRGVSDYTAYEARWADTGIPVQPEEWASARAVQHGEVVVNQELQIERFDGTRAYVLNSAAPIRDANGGIIGCAVAIRDITEHKQAEELNRQIELQMQQTQKEESLGVLAGGIAHDFNNLLGIIVGNIDLVSGRLPADSPSRRLLDKAQDASRHAAALCQQMLAYVGKSPLSLCTTKPNELFREVEHLIAASVSKHVQLQWNLAHRLPLVYVDPARIRQVIMNLVINASEAIGDAPGQITLTTGSAPRTTEELQSPWLKDPLPPGEYVFLDVADTGCGIEPQVLGRVFEPFFTTKFTGRGLGLAAALGIVRSHQGSIQVESAHGRGSTFRVWLPALATESSDTEMIARPPQKWRGTGTVLVVDDDEDIRAVAQGMLELVGFKTVAAADGLEAVEIYRADPERFCCVLLDATMPKLDGAATYKELARIRPDVRVILSSGYTKSDIAARFAGCGLAGFLPKPYTLDDLTAALRSLGHTRVDNN